MLRRDDNALAFLLLFPALRASHNGLQSKYKEADMGNLVAIGQFWGGVFGFFGGLGVFFMGIGLLWFVGVYKDQHKKA